MPTMSNQSPSANGRDQRGRDDLRHEERPAVQDESGFEAGAEPSTDALPPSTDIDQTDDPSKD